MSSQSDQHPRADSGRICRSCGRALGPRSTSAVCPRCALRTALAPEPNLGMPGEGHGAPIRVFGEYHIHSEIARGGMGIIYKARHARLNRWVALKVIVGGEFAAADFKQRFRTEAQAAAALEHPNIVPIYEVGEEDGQLYFTMKLVDGGTLTSWLAPLEPSARTGHDESPGAVGGASLEHRQLSAGKARRSPETRLRDLTTIAATVMKLARAVQFAHDRGVLHRDLKPNNVLVDSAGELYLTDFGLAKLVEKDGSFTRTMAVLGTPSYMAPEQARGDTRQITIASDVYGLGAILYELIAGRPPFTGQSPLEIIRELLEREPLVPSLAARKGVRSSSGTGSGHMSHDLDTICLKCLEKEPGRRYASALALAEDLQRWLNHEPIHARQASVLERVQKWIRRKPAWAGLIATVTMSLAALAIGSILFTAQVMNARSTAERANRALSRNLFVREWLDAESLLDEGKTTAALVWFARAAREHPGDFAVQTRLLSLLTERDYALPARQPLMHGSAVNNGAFLSDGRHFVTAGIDGTVRVWPLDSATEPRILSNRFENPVVAALPRDNLMLVDDPGSFSLWDLNGPVKSIPRSHLVNGRLPVSPDGRLTGIFGTRSGWNVWDIAACQPTGRSFEEIIPYPQLAGFTPDGKYVIGCDKTGHLLAWEISSGRLAWKLPYPSFRGEGIVRADVYPAGKSMLVSSWVSAAGGELSGWTFEPSPSNAPPATASSEGWALPTRSTITEWCFSADGKEAYVADAEGHLGTLNLVTHALHTLNAEHDGRVTWMGLSRNGQHLATTSTDGSARLWDVRMKSPEPMVITNGPSVWDARFSPDSLWFVCTGMGAAEIRDAHSAALIRRLPLHSFVTHSDISPDSRRVVACSDRGQTAVWDADTGNKLFAPLEGDPAHYVEFSRDGGRFLVVRFLDVSGKATIEIHQTETGRQIGPALTNSTQVVSAHFDPAGRRLVAVCDNGEIEFWSLPEGRPESKRPRHKDVIWTARFSSDGRQLLTASRDRTAVLWDVETGRRIFELRHDEQVYNAAFSPDGSRIVTGDASRKAHLWDAKTGNRLFSLPAHPGGVWYGEFSTDGRLLLTGDDAGNARLWEAATGLPLGGWIHNGVSLKRTHLSPDGRMALSAAENGTVRLWPVVLASVPAPAWLPDLAEALAGHRLRADGSPEPVLPDRLQALNKSLGSLPDNDFYTRWSRWFFVERMQPHPPEFK